MGCAAPHIYPYDVFMDKNGELWSGYMAGDRIPSCVLTRKAAARAAACLS
jgi:hypothetical protein